MTMTSGGHFNDQIQYPPVLDPLGCVLHSPGCGPIESEGGSHCASAQGAVMTPSSHSLLHSCDLPLASGPPTLILTSLLFS